MNSMIMGTASTAITASTLSSENGDGTLILNEPSPFKNSHSGSKALIYADGISLTIEGKGEIKGDGIEPRTAVNKGSLTLKTDHLSVFSNNYGLYIEGESQDDPESLNILSGTLNVDSQISTAIYTKNANLLIQDDPGGLTEVSSVIAAGSDAYSINGDFTIGDTLDIITPENAKIDSEGSSRYVYDTDRNEKALRVVISRREDDLDVPPATYNVIYWITGDIPSDMIEPEPQTGLEAGAQESSR